MNKTIEQDNLNLIESLNNLLNNWWKIALCAVVFGLIGLGFSFISPPKYEAEALFSVTIDFREINFENLVDETDLPVKFTLYDRDLALSVVPRAILKVRSQVVDYARTLDPELDDSVFEENSVIERLHDRWRLRYRHEEPQVAQSIVNYWADLGMVQLEEEQAAETMEPYVLVDLILRAHLPQSPIYQNRNSLILAGTVIGFCVGIIALDMKYRYFSTSRVQKASQKGE